MALFGKKQNKQQSGFQALQLTVDPTVAPRPDSPDTPWSQLLPMLKRTDAYAFAPVGPYLVSRPLGPFLIEALAFDSPEMMAVLNSTMPQANQAPVEEYFSTARHNMAAIPLHAFCFAADQRPISAYRIEGPVGYATSWVTRPDLIAQMIASHGGTGEPLVIPCDRDLLQVCTTSDLAVVESTLDQAWNSTYTAKEFPNPISPAVYRFDQGALVPWQSPAPGPIDTKQRRALAYLSWVNYLAQYQWLVADNYARLGELPSPENGELYVAGAPDFGTKPDPDPGYLAWSPLVPYEPDDEVLICPLETVSLTDREGRTVMVPYAAFVEICANMVRTETSLPLPMTRVRGWPTPEQMARLEQQALVVTGPARD